MLEEPLIKYYFPTERASEESLRERGTRIPSPLFYLHLWWARRPLIGCRATIASAVVRVKGKPDKSFIEEFERAVKLLLPKGSRSAYNYQSDLSWIASKSNVREARLLDVFAGGGSIPFEALRLGFKEVVAVEYNPVAYIVLKATLEYPLKYGERLVRDVERWARWLLEEAKKRLSKYYPPHPKGRPTNYIWVRVFKSRSGILVPALTNPILSKDKKYAMKVEYENGNPKIRVFKYTGRSDEVKTTYSNFKGGQLECPDRTTLNNKEMQGQYRRCLESWEREGAYGYHPVTLAAVKLEDGSFVEPTPEIVEATRRAEEDLRRMWDELVEEDLVPTEEVPRGEKNGTLLAWGMDRYYKLFSARQLLSHATIVKLIREAYKTVRSETGDEEYAKAVVAYLALAHGKLLDYNSAITTWDSYGAGSINHTFSRHAYTFGRDFGEGDLVTPSTGLDWVLFSNRGVIAALKRIVELLKGVKGKIKVLLGDAADPSLYVELGEFDYVITDPPYYSNVQYCELSDFFYVWLKRSIGHLYPEAFSAKLTPKDKEIVVNRARGKDERWFEGRMKEILSLIKNSLKPGGLAVLMYAHRSARGLRAMLEAALEAGLKPVAVWSFASEQPKSLHLVGKAAVRSLLVIALEPREKIEGGLWDARMRVKVRKAVEEAVNVTLKYGLRYCDAMLAGMGAAYRVVGTSWPLKTIEGKRVSLEEILKFASEIVSRVVLEKIVQAEVDPVSGLYLLARVVYGEVEHDWLRINSYGLGVDHEQFIARYCKKPKVRQEDRTKVFPIRNILEIEVKEADERALINLLALAARNYSSSGPDVAREVLARARYSRDVVTRYLELLLQEAVDQKEKKVLQGLLLALENPLPSHNSGLESPRSRSQTNITDFF